jgi:MFS family permease
MSIFRITLRDLGYTDRQSLTVIEFHFFAMYFPGFFSGTFIKKHGVVRACQVAVTLFLVAFAFNMAAADRNDALYSWYLGLVCVGFGWNFGFTSATVWVTKAYQAAPHLKAKVQALNECLVFLISGSLIFSTGFLYEDAGGGGIPGWRLLNYMLLGLMSLFMATLCGFMRFQQGRDDDPKQTEHKHQDGDKRLEDTELVEVN